VEADSGPVERFRVREAERVGRGGGAVRDGGDAGVGHHVGVGEGEADSRADAQVRGGVRVPAGAGDHGGHARADPGRGRGERRAGAAEPGAHRRGGGARGLRDRRAAERLGGGQPERAHQRNPHRRHPAPAPAQAHRGPPRPLLPLRGPHCLRPRAHQGRAGRQPRRARRRLHQTRPPNRLPGRRALRRHGRTPRRRRPRIQTPALEGKIPPKPETFNSLEETHLSQGSLFWLQSEGGINSDWCISGGKHSHLLRKDLCRTLISPCPALWFCSLCLFNNKGAWLAVQVQAMAGDVEPLLKEVREGGLLKDFESLTKVAAEAGRDLRSFFWLPFCQCEPFFCEKNYWYQLGIHYRPDSHVNAQCRLRCWAYVNESPW
jgi:hypothetical protein